MANQAKYTYSVSMSFVNKGKTMKIDSEYISMIMINHDYSSQNMPIVIVTCNIPVNTYNSMITNKSTGKIMLKLSSKDSKIGNKISKERINGEFDYIFPENKKEVNTDLYVTKNIHESSAAVSVTMALFSDELNNINRQNIINNIYTNSTRGEIIYSLLRKSHNNRKLIIEPFADNSKIKRLLVPPIISIADFLKYMDYQIGLYKKEYMFYLDFDCTYLLSFGGVKFNYNGYGHQTIIIDILKNTEEMKSKTDGIVEDSVKKQYTIPVNSECFNPVLNTYTEKKFNTIRLIDGSGKYKDISVKVNNKKSATPKYEVFRISELNKFRDDILKNTIEGSTFNVTITKAAIDPFILQPFKKYTIKNTDDYKEYNGGYALTSKREIYANMGEHFECSMQFNLQKI